MSYKSILDSEISTGSPVRVTTQTTIQGNLEDHQSRINALELTFSTSTPITFDIQGFYCYAGPVPIQIGEIILPFKIKITSVYLTIKNAGTVGTTTEIDLKAATPSNSTLQYASVLTTRPSLIQSAGSFKTSDGSPGTVAAVIGNSTLVAGTYLGLFLTQAQTQAEGLTVTVNYNKV